MGKKRSTKATASIQPYVGPELLDTPEQREVDQDQTTGSPAQEAALGPSETAAESDKTPNRRLKSIFRDPIPEIARKMQAAHDKQISDCLQKIQATSEPWWELPETPEQREVDQDQITGSLRLAFWNFDTLLNRKANQDQSTGSPAQQAVASPSEPATIQKSSKTGNVGPRIRKQQEERDVVRNRLILEMHKTGKKPKQIMALMNTKHGYDMSLDAIGKVIKRKSSAYDKQDKQDKQDK